MGTVITFPAERSGRGSSLPEFRAEHASVVILPVIRIERHDESASGGFEPNPRSTPGRKRRKR
jgi:hypothetical protein